MARGKHCSRTEVFHTRSSYPSRAVVSRSAFEHNLSVAQRLAGNAEVMAVVKADAYGHGAVTISRWAIDAGVQWLVIAQLGEAINVRRQIGISKDTATDPACSQSFLGWEITSPGDSGPHILALISEPEDSISSALELGIDLTVGSQAKADTVARTAAQTSIPARIHLEIDTGMARAGVTLSDLPEIAQSLADYENAGLIKTVGVWTHLACADEPDSPVTAKQVDIFEQALGILAEHNVHPPMIHMAASAGLLWHPSTHYTAVRPGIMLYGLSPNPHVATARELGLEPVMSLEADIVSVRDVPAGTGISYGHTARTEHSTRLATVPLGYADGIPRSASNNASVCCGGVRYPQRGRVCMDQFVIEAPHAQVGDPVVVFGADPSPSADEWAEQAGTIGYEMVARVGKRVPRIYKD